MVESPEELEAYDLVIPIEPPEVWCAGVTYELSRDARIEESTVKDVYALVYEADRPELFLKDAACRRTVGPGEPIGVRDQSRKAPAAASTAALTSASSEAGNLPTTSAGRQGPRFS